MTKDDQRNLVVCPLPYDGSYMELFYAGWRIVQRFIAADAKVPGEDALPLPHERQVARELEMRRDSTRLRAIEVLEVQAQRGLIQSTQAKPELTTERASGAAPVADSMLAPIPLES